MCWAAGWSRPLEHCPGVLIPGALWGPSLCVFSSQTCRAGTHVCTERKGTGGRRGRRGVASVTPSHTQAAPAPAASVSPPPASWPRCALSPRLLPRRAPCCPSIRACLQPLAERSADLSHSITAVRWGALTVWDPAAGLWPRGLIGPPCRSAPGRHTLVRSLACFTSSRLRATPEGVSTVPVGRRGN